MIRVTTRQPCSQPWGDSGRDQETGRRRCDPMVQRYQHAAADRDGFLARATAPFVPIPRCACATLLAHSAPNSLMTRPFTLDDVLTSTDDDSSSGGETRTLNLAGRFRHAA